MNDKLPPEVRAKVAGECDPKDWCKNSRGEIVVIENCWPYGGGGYIPNTTSEWMPKTDLRQKDALTRTAARLIAEKPDCMPRLMLFERLGKAIVTNDVNALERLVAELKGFL